MRLHNSGVAAACGAGLSRTGACLDSLVESFAEQGCEKIETHAVIPEKAVGYSPEMVDEVAAENRCHMQPASARAVGFENAPAQRSGQQSDSRVVALYKNGYISEISAPSAAECLERIDYPPARPQRFESLYRN